jgi:hypothetical protein
MKMKKYVIILLFILVYSCEKNESIETELNGKWVRVDRVSDTIIFGDEEPDNMFNLKRGYDIIDGNKTPITPFGLYEYKIYQDSIWVQWSLSSYLSQKKYFFKLNNSTIEIEDFIDKTNTNIIFEKVK